MTWFAWALLSALFAGITAILAKIGVTGVDTRLAAAIRTTFALGFAWVVALAFNPATAPLRLAGRAWLFLALSGIATGLSWLCYFRALQLGDVTKVAPIDKLSLVFTVAFAALFLGEPPTPKILAGLGLICAGVVVMTLKSS